MKNIKINLMLLFCAFSIITNGESDCKNALYQANKLYESGKIQEAITRLESCITADMSDEEISESYKLLASAYSDLKKNEERDKYLLLLLKEKPNYQNTPNNDSKEITIALNQFNVTPLFHLGFKIGTNVNNPVLVESYSPVDFDQKYLPTFGYQFGLELDYNPFKNTAFTVGMMLRGIGIRHELTDDENWKKNYSELMIIYGISAGAIRYVPIRKNLRGFVGLGAGLGFLNNSKVNVKTQRFSPKSIDQQSKVATSERIGLMPNLNTRIGLAINLNNRAFVKMDLGLTSYTNTTVKKDQRVKDSEFIFQTRYISDDIKPRLMTFNVTFLAPIFYKFTKES